MKKIKENKFLLFFTFFIVIFVFLIAFSFLTGEIPKGLFVPLLIVSIIIILGTILSRKNFENLGKDREKFVEEIANELGITNEEANNRIRKETGRFFYYSIVYTDENVLTFLRRRVLRQDEKFKKIELDNYQALKKEIDEIRKKNYEKEIQKYAGIGAFSFLIFLIMFVIYFALLVVLKDLEGSVFSKAFATIMIFVLILSGFTMNKVLAYTSKRENIIYNVAKKIADTVSENEEDKICNQYILSTVMFEQIKENANEKKPYLLYEGNFLEKVIESYNKEFTS